MGCWDYRLRLVAVDPCDIIGHGGGVAVNVSGRGEHLTSVGEHLQYVPDPETIRERLITVPDDGVIGQVGRGAGPRARMTARRTR